MMFAFYGVSADLTGVAKCEATVWKSKEKAVGATGGTVQRCLRVREHTGGFRADPSRTANPHHPLFDHGETDTELPIDVVILLFRSKELSYTASVRTTCIF